MAEYTDSQASPRLPEMEEMLTTSAFECSAGGLEHGDGFAVEEDDRAEVHVELHVKALGLDLADGGADADAGVVHEHVQAAVAVARGRRRPA